MHTMDALFEGGRVIDLILLLMVVEAIVFAALYYMRGKGIAPVRLLPNLLAGAFLMLALRAALTGAGTLVIGGWLALGLAGHLADLVTRWPRKKRLFF
jgi:hypothetical protein